MKYKCSECGEEFNIKPDYCDCGNDKFEELQSLKNERYKISLFKKYGINPFAFFFFIFCIILSGLVLLFFFNPEEKPAKKEHQSRRTQSIPPLESFWNSSAPEKETEEEIVEIIQIIEKPRPKYVQKTSVSPKSDSVRKSISKPDKKPVSKPVSQTRPAAKPKMQAKSKSTGTISKSNAANVHSYKIRLRNALFSHLYAGNIEGGGKCGIEFSVNDSGKLINRAFTFQSDNRTLNDEVYRMMMRMPVFSAPPEGYKGEKIKITFEFNNGQYEVKLIE